MTPLSLKKGRWLNGYLTCFTGLTRVAIQDCPADICLIEEVILIRNSVQHQSDICLLRIGHSKDNLKKLRRVFFVADHEQNALNEIRDSGESSFFAPRLDLTAERIEADIVEVERLCGWLDEMLWTVLYPR